MIEAGTEGVTVLGVLESRTGSAIGIANPRSAPPSRRQAGRVPVIVGASHAGTQATIDLVTMAADLGATAVMIAPTAEPVPNDDRVFDYFRRVGEKARLPVVLQDHPASTAVHMPVALMLKNRARSAAWGRDSRRKRCRRRRRCAR